MPTEAIILILAIAFLFLGSIPAVERTWRELHDITLDYIESRGKFL